MMKKTKLIITLLILNFGLTMCEFGEYETKNELLDKKFIFDRKLEQDNRFQSKLLDNLFQKKGIEYQTIEYPKENYEEYYSKIVDLYNDDKFMVRYLLIYTESDTLRDTLRLEGKNNISLNAIYYKTKNHVYKNRNLVLAIGTMDISHSDYNYFKINQLYELNKNFKIQKLNRNIKLDFVEPPNDYYYNEFSKSFDNFHYGIKDKFEGHKISDIPEKFHGKYYASASLEEGNASVTYYFNITAERIILNKNTYHAPIGCIGLYYATVEEDTLSLYYDDDEANCKSKFSSFSIKSQNSKLFAQGLGGIATEATWIELKPEM